MADQNELIAQQYGAAKQNLLQKQKVAQEDAQMGVNRNLAITGLSGGAALKAQQKANRNVNETFAGAQTDLEGQQAKALQDVQAQKEAQAFQSSERQAGQTFAGTQAELQRQYGTQERLGGQQFQAGETAASRQQQESQFARQYGLQNQQFEEARNQFSQQMNYQWQELDENKRTNLVNTLIALDKSGLSDTNYLFRLLGSRNIIRGQGL